MEKEATQRKTEVSGMWMSSDDPIRREQLTPISQIQLFQPSLPRLQTYQWSCLVSFSHDPTITASTGEGVSHHYRFQYNSSMTESRTIKRCCFQPVYMGCYFFNMESNNWNTWQLKTVHYRNNLWRCGQCLGKPPSRLCSGFSLGREPLSIDV